MIMPAAEIEEEIRQPKKEQPSWVPEARVRTAEWAAAVRGQIDINSNWSYFGVSAQ